MRILVDEIPKYPEDCLFSIRNANNGVVYYTCILKENIQGKHKNSPCLCKSTKYCNCLKRLDDNEDRAW